MTRLPFQRATRPRPSSTGPAPPPPFRIPPDNYWPGAAIVAGTVTNTKGPKVMSVSGPVFADGMLFGRPCLRTDVSIGDYVISFPPQMLNPLACTFAFTFQLYANPPGLLAFLNDGDASTDSYINGSPGSYKLELPYGVGTRPIVVGQTYSMIVQGGSILLNLDGIGGIGGLPQTSLDIRVFREVTGFSARCGYVLMQDAAQWSQAFSPLDITDLSAHVLAGNPIA